MKDVRGWLPLALVAAVALFGVDYYLQARDARRDADRLRQERLELAQAGAALRDSLQAQRARAEAAGAELDSIRAQRARAEAARAAERRRLQDDIDTQMASLYAQLTQQQQRELAALQAMWMERDLSWQRTVQQMEEEIHALYAAYQGERLARVTAQTLAQLRTEERDLAVAEADRLREALAPGFWDRLWGWRYPLVVGAVIGWGVATAR